MLLSYVGLLAYLIVAAQALQLDVHGQRKTQQAILGRRAPGIKLNNTADVSYYAELRFGGKEFTLLVDTGSSDLWIAGDVPNSKSTPFSSGINYAVGSVNGPIKTTYVEFVGYTVPDQAFLQIPSAQNNEAGDGIIGLGPNYGSNIYQEMGSVAGAAILDRIFLQNITTPNYLTVLLGRSADPTDFYSGSLTIGEVLDGFEDVIKQPKLPVINLENHKRGDQHFQVLLDEDGLIGPDGKPISLNTDVSTAANKKQATVVIDTGFSLPQLPRPAASAIYSGFHGAELYNIDTVGQVWIVPCMQEVNITFKFAGKRYSIHPLDATINPNTIGLPNVYNSKGQNSCIGTFQPFSYDRGSSPTYDMVLGMAFLRNIYLLMDYGDFLVGSTETDDPYLQFLSTTDPTEAHRDFVKARLNGTDSTSEKGSANNNSSPPRHVYYIVAVLVVVVVLVCVSVATARRGLVSAGYCCLN